MIDEELFELCKEVYLLTDWTATDFAFWNYKNTDDEPEWEIHPVVNDRDRQLYFVAHKVPLYTSDYLLEKLPKYFDGHWLAVAPIASKTWSAGYIKRFDPEIKHDNWSDTPLKALLKLTLALHESGEIK